MSTLTHIAIHHSGGTVNNPFASTRHVTPAQINAYHKERFKFPSQFIPEQNGGYNFGYSPISRTIHQFRALGEETAAQKGWNFNTVSLCVFGNYTYSPHTKQTVDPMTKEMEEDIARFVYNLTTGNHNWVTAPNTKFDLSASRVYPHRWYQTSTECYGTGLSDNWIDTILATYKITPTADVEKRAALMREVLKLYRILLSLLQTKGGILTQRLGVSRTDRGGCPEKINDYL